MICSKAIKIWLWSISHFSLCDGALGAARKTYRGTIASRDLFLRTASSAWYRPLRWPGVSFRFLLLLTPRSGLGCSNRRLRVCKSCLACSANVLRSIIKSKSSTATCNRKALLNVYCVEYRPKIARQQRAQTASSASKPSDWGKQRSCGPQLLLIVDFMLPRFIIGRPTLVIFQS